jgi:hypothetical protein
LKKVSGIKGVDEGEGRHWVCDHDLGGGDESEGKGE